MFKSIDELEERLYCCAGCELPISTVIFNAGKQNASLLAQNNLTVDNKDIIYDSIREDDIISFGYSIVSGKSNTIFTINALTSKVEGKLEYIQNVLWNNHLTILRYCNNKKCNNRYMFESGRLFLERKNMKIYPFSANLEGYVHKRDNMSYTLFNTSENAMFAGKTTLMSYEPDIVLYEKAELVAKLPKIDFSTIKTGIDKKIKTIITFL